VLPAIWDDTITAPLGFVFAIIWPCLIWFMMPVHAEGFEVVVLGPVERQGGLPASLRREWSGQFPAFRRTGWLSRNLQVSGSIGHLQPDISPSYGFTAIIVAFLGV